MLLLNFAHPFTDEQVSKIEEITDQPVDRSIDFNSQIDTQQPLIPQVLALVDQAGLSAAEWQMLLILVNPPSLNFVAVTLLAEIHGRCGYFPPVIRLRPVQDSLPPRYEVAEVINLQKIRDTARTKR